MSDPRTKKRITALRKYLLAGTTGLKSRLAYLGNYGGRALSYGLFVFVFCHIWNAAFAARLGAAGSAGRIAGYSLSMTVWYFIIAEISIFAFGGFFSRLSEDVKSGQVSYLVGRPYSFVGYHFAEALGPALVDAAVFLVEGSALGLAFVGPPPGLEAWRLAALALALVFAGAVQFSLQFLIAMTAFWTEENSAFFWIYQKLYLVAGTLLPLEFLPQTAQTIVAATPLPAVAYAPARIAVAASPGETFRLLESQAAWGVLAYALCLLVFRAARKNLSVNGG